MLRWKKLLNCTFKTNNQTHKMTTDTQIAELANMLILDMYQCHKQGIFKGYINWFAASYQRAVEARRHLDSFITWTTVSKPVSSGPTTALIPGLTGYVEVPIPKEIKTTVTVASKPFRQVIKKPVPTSTEVLRRATDLKAGLDKLANPLLGAEVIARFNEVNKHVISMHMPAKISDVLYDTPDEPKTQDQSPLTVKIYPGGAIEYGYDPTKGTCEQAARDLVKRYTDVWGADSVATIPHEPKGTLSTGTFDLTSKP